MAFYAMVFLLLPSDVCNASLMMEFLLPSPLKRCAIVFFASHLTRLPDVSPLLTCTMLPTSFLIQPLKSVSNLMVGSTRTVVASAKVILMCLTESVTYAWP